MAARSPASDTASGSASDNPTRVDVDGRRLDPATPALPALDGGLLRGWAAFETIAAYGGEPFRFDSHVARLRHSGEAFDLAVPDAGELERRCRELLECNGLLDAERARLRITVISGASRHPDSPPAGDHVVVEATPAPDCTHPARVATVPFIRNERGALSGLKTVNYGENFAALRRARQAGADEALFANTRDHLCEGAWSNVFLRLDGDWCTPPLSSGCLPGVTRAVVLERARDLGVPIAEADVPFSDTARVEAAFLTSTLREIQPIAHLDGRDLATLDEIGRLRTALREHIAEATGRT